MKQKRVLAVHDLSCVGRCSLTVALPILSAAGLEASAVREASRDVAAGSVIRQEQEAGSQVEKGSAVTFVVSTGAPKETQRETTAARQTPARPPETAAQTPAAPAAPVETTAAPTTAQTAAQTTTADNGNDDLLRLLEEHDQHNR